MKTVYIIFKTHLDIGYTNLAEKITDNYLKSFIPAAIKTGYELKGTDTPFVWTAGSWIIDRALKGELASEVEQAIKDGIINWHALPFTTHTEIMSEKLFDYGLGISAALDKRFGRVTTGAKMTDVPGHTVGMLPHLCRAGVKFLHIGVNPATPMPPVPEIFRWKRGDDSIVVMYQKAYGEVADYGDFVVYFAHTNDNKGPQSKEEIKAVYEDIAHRFPDCEIKAATLDDVAEAACRIPNLPVLEAEIGDTWIHGAGTDPEKLSRYKRLLREIEDKDIAKLDLTDNLLLVPEHTWGVAIQSYFPNQTHWTHSEMEALRGRDNMEFLEQSWEEQREYVRRAERLLGVEPEYPISKPSLDGYELIKNPELDFEISWQLFSNEDYKRYEKDYLRLTEENTEWAHWDYTKVGLPDYEGGIFTAEPVKSYKKADSIIYELRFNKAAEEKHGLPYFLVERAGDMLNIKWFGKKPSRLPQAFWLKLKGYDEGFELEKLGEWINPYEIVGSPLICAVNRKVRSSDTEIELLDSSLVAPFGRKLLHYAERGSAQDMYFNLYNNIWNTNFPMWYSDDAMFRFIIRKRKDLKM